MSHDQTTPQEALSAIRTSDADERRKRFDDARRRLHEIMQRWDERLPPEAQFRRPPTAERIARAWDPVGWAWYDRAPDDHPAKPIFLADTMKRARDVMAALEATP